MKRDGKRAPRVAFARDELDKTQGPAQLGTKGMGFPFNRPKASKARRLMTPTVRLSSAVGGWLWPSDPPAAAAGQGSWGAYGFIRHCGWDWRC